MNNNIKEDYCSFEVSKLLKKKGLIMYCKHSFWKGEFTQSTPGYPLEDGSTSQDKYHSVERYYAPTHSIAIKWIRENFEININIYPEQGFWDINIYDLSKRECLYHDGTFNSPEEATEAGLLHVLKTLI